MADRYAVETVFKAHDQMSRALNRLRRNTDTFANRLEARIKRMGAVTNRVQRGMADKLRQMTFAAIPAGFAMKSIYGTFAEFEANMVSATAKMGIFRSEAPKAFQEISDAVKETGRETKFTMLQMSKLAVLMGQAGLKGPQTKALLRPVADFALAVREDVDEAFNKLSNIAGSFGVFVDKDDPMLSENILKVANMTAYAVNNATMSLEDFREAMIYSGKMAKEYGMDMSDAIAAVMTLADAGVRGSIGGTGLQRVLQYFIKPSKDAQTMLNQLGVSFTNKEGDFKNAIGTFSELQEKLKTASQSERAFFISELSGLIGFKSAVSLIDAADKSLKKYAAGVKDAHKQGYMKKLAVEQMATLEFAGQRLASSIESVKISIGELNSKSLSELIHNMATWLNKNEELIAQRVGAFMETIIRNAGLIAGVTGGFVGLTVAAFSLNQILSATLAIITATKWVAGLGLIQGAVTGLSVAFGGLFAVIKTGMVTVFTGMLLNPVTWAILAIGALVFSIYNFAEHWQRLGDIISRSFSYVIDGVWQQLLGAIETIKDFYNWWHGQDQSGVTGGRGSKLAQELASDHGVEILQRVGPDPTFNVTMIMPDGTVVDETKVTPKNGSNQLKLSTTGEIIE